jgi:hypothetical protein
MARLYAAAAALVLLLAACGHTARADTLDIGDLAGTGLPDVRPWWRITVLAQPVFV